MTGCPKIFMDSKTSESHQHWSPLSWQDYPGVSVWGTEAERNGCRQRRFVFRGGILAIKCQGKQLRIMKWKVGHLVGVKVSGSKGDREPRAINSNRLWKCYNSHKLKEHLPTCAAWKETAGYAVNIVLHLPNDTVSISSVTLNRRPW